MEPLGDDDWRTVREMISAWRKKASPGRCGPGRAAVRQSHTARFRRAGGEAALAKPNGVFQWSALPALALSFRETGTQRASNFGFRSRRRRVSLKITWLNVGLGKTAGSSDSAQDYASGRRARHDYRRSICRIRKRAAETGRTVHDCGIRSVIRVSAGQPHPDWNDLVYRDLAAGHRSAAATNNFRNSRPAVPAPCELVRAGINDDR